MGFRMGKSENYYFLITIAALDLKVTSSIQVNVFMKLSEYQGQGHSLTLVKGHSDLNVKTFFLKDSWAIWSQSLYESLRENGNENLYK